MSIPPNPKSTQPLALVLLHEDGRSYIVDAEARKIVRRHPNDDDQHLSWTVESLSTAFTGAKLDIPPVKRGATWRPTESAAARLLSALGKTLQEISQYFCAARGTEAVRRHLRRIGAANGEGLIPIDTRLRGALRAVSPREYTTEEEKRLRRTVSALRKDRIFPFYAASALDEFVRGEIDEKTLRARMLAQPANRHARPRRYKKVSQEQLAAARDRAMARVKHLPSLRKRAGSEGRVTIH